MSESEWVLGMTSRCVGACGFKSLITIRRSFSCTILAFISFEAILQNMQSIRYPLDLFSSWPEVPNLFSSSPVSSLSSIPFSARRTSVWKSRSADS